MKRAYWTITLACSCMAILILDTKTALAGAADGLTLCLWTLIPSLFPFILLSKMLISTLLGRKIPVIARLGRLLKIPAGAESIFLVGLLGGYPIGAQCISQAVHERHISQKNGERMLAFCSNAGPAFLFGIGARLFSDIRLCWFAWLIHILSAVITAVLTPEETEEIAQIGTAHSTDLPAALNVSIHTMSTVCGWVIVFRIILAFCERWFLWSLPQWVQYLFAGFLELSNGCCVLVNLPDEKLRFVMFATFLGYGGSCVTMQTKSVCEGLKIRSYILGKLSQSIISFFLAAATVYGNYRAESLLLLCCFCFGCYFFSRKSNKTVAFSRRRVYNKENTYAR